MIHGNSGPREASVYLQLAARSVGFCHPSLLPSKSRERFMRLRQLGLLASVSFGAILVQAGLAPGALAQSGAALTGVVSSQEEGNMEGVLVNAKKEGATVTITVVTDQKGNYSFPADRLSPGKYTISIRAAGYTLLEPKATEVTAGATADLKLGKARNLAATLSNGEWLTSLPGSHQQKQFMIQCVGCHTLQRVLTSAHDAAEYEQVFNRMGRYSPGSTPIRPQPLLPGPRGARPHVSGN